MNTLFVIVGNVAVALGAVGTIIPGLPTVPFLLLAAACYARGAPRYYNWLLQHKRFGPTVHNWQSGQGMTVGAKRVTIMLMVLTMGANAALVPFWPVRILLLLIFIVVSWFILSRPTAPSKRE